MAASTVEGQPSPACPGAGAGEVAVQLEGITKRFPGVVANKDIRLTVRKSTVHAIVGENGAGKSTLMKILYGMQPPDEGTITVNGTDVRFKSPTDAIKVGIGMVHQHFMLADNMTVLENVILGNEPGSAFAIAEGKARDRIDEINKRYGLNVDPEALVATLSVGKRQQVEILKVLYRGAEIIILDEPTAVLVPQEVDELFANLGELKAQGVTILFISHKLDEVLSIADGITVIRAGTTVGEVDDPKTVTTRQLAEMMVGSELPSPETTESTVTDKEVVHVEDLTVATPAGRLLVDHVSLTIHAGEIVGIAGVDGNGQSELIEALMGLVPHEKGRIVLADRDITRLPTRRRREMGLGYVPEDRHRHGLLLSQPLWENDMLGHQTQQPFSGGFMVYPKAAAKHAAKVIADFDVRTPGVDVAALALSGGNQQKFIIGRELSANPVALIAAHPTRGVDVGAQAAIWDQLRDARAGGLATLLISADLDELIGLSDRLLVIFDGRIVADLEPAEVTPETLGSYMTGGSPEDAGSTAHGHARSRADDPDPNLDSTPDSTLDFDSDSDRTGGLA